MRPGLKLSLVLAFCALPITAMATPKAYFPGPAYVTVQGSNAVEVLPAGTLWKDITAAHYADVSPDGSRVFVTSAQPGQAYVMDAKTGKRLALIPVGEGAQGVKISPDGRWALVVAQVKGEVVVVDLRKLKAVKSIAVGDTPHNVSFSPDSHTAYVTLQGGTGVAVVDMQSLKKTGEIPVPGLSGPHNLDLSDHGRLMWVRDIKDNVAVVDLHKRKVLHIIKVGNGHAGIDVIPGGKYVFTGAIGDHVVDVIDPHTYKVVKRIDVGQGPHGVRASRDGRWVYAAVTSTNKVAVIDTRTLKVVEQIPVKGTNPFWVAVQGNE